jgi:hypothetical protein
MRSNILGYQAAFGLLIVLGTACSDNSVTGSLDIRPGVIHPDPIVLSWKNLNTCNAVFLARRDPLGYISRQITIDGINVSEASAGAERAITRVHFTRFEVSTKAIVITEADCAIDARLRASTALLGSLGRIEGGRRGAVRSFADGGIVDCFYYPDSNSIECDGEYCSQLWAMSKHRNSANLSINDTFRCSGSGCTVYGTSGYSCDGGGGGSVETEDGDGGSDGGGSGSGDPPATAPGDIDQDDYDKLNREEKWLWCRIRWIACTTLTLHRARSTGPLERRAAWAS